MKPISFIQPSRSNLKYLKWSYNSIRKNLGYIHEICWADDFSDDGTWEWMQEIVKKDPNVKIHRNEGPNRLGHTILYDTLVNDYATNDIVMIYHADMYACPGLDEYVLNHIKPATIVSATRIEPPLHPDGPEKILKDFGIEPEEFDERGLLEFVMDYNSKKHDRPTKGIFAPWAIHKKDFQAINGHDPLYAPQSKEDSDIFNRFYLNGYQFRQIWDGFVYHLTSRGSRFRDGVGKNSDEWLYSNNRNMRNFIRKWGTQVLHDSLMKPIVYPKYNIGLVVENCSMDLLRAIEPWCTDIYGSWLEDNVEQYIDVEDKETEFDIRAKIHTIYDEPTNEIICKFDGSRINNENVNFVSQIPFLIKDQNLEVGTYEFDIFTLIVKGKNYDMKKIIKSKPLKSYGFDL